MGRGEERGDGRYRERGEKGECMKREGKEGKCEGMGEEGEKGRGR